MRKRFLVGAMALLALFAVQANATNLVANGDFSTNDETGWTQWSSPWGSGFSWDASTGAGVLKTDTGSFGWYQAIPTVPGEPYTITANWIGTGTWNWVEVLFFNDDGREVYLQLDSPLDSSVIAKVDGWGMNGGMPFDGAITAYYYPNGPGTNVITATGTTMYVGLKAGATNTDTPGSVQVAFDDVVVTPEPVTLALLGLPALALLRRRS